MQLCTARGVCFNITCLTAGSAAQSRLEDDEASDVDGANYQLEMMRCLREVNVDNNTVGWCASLPYRHSACTCSPDAQPAHNSAGSLPSPWLKQASLATLGTSPPSWARSRLWS